MKQNKIIFIVGPTGVGKSQAALALAVPLNAEIVSCDAMQVYKEASIANDKPSPEDLAKVPHHLVDCVSVSEEYDVARYRKDAVAKIDDIIARGKMPLIVGGSGMYMSILLDGIFEGPKEDPQIRRQIREDAQVQGIEKIYSRLKKVDPQAAQAINPNDERRIIRALEVYLLTKKPISQLQKQRRGLWGNYDIQIFALNRERDELYDRVNQRVDQMFDRGLIEEIKKLNALPLSRTAKGLIGIPEITGYCAGERSLEDAKELMKMNTRHYVKRQLTWFRKDKRLKWIMLKAQETAQDAAQKILKEDP